MPKLLKDDVASLLHPVFTLADASGTAEKLPVQCSTMLLLLRACQALHLLPSPQLKHKNLQIKELFRYICCCFCPHACAVCLTNAAAFITASRLSVR